MSLSLRRVAVVAGFWMLSFLLSWATAVRADTPPAQPHAPLSAHASSDLTTAARS